MIRSVMAGQNAVIAGFTAHPQSEFRMLGMICIRLASDFDKQKQIGLYSLDEIMKAQLSRQTVLSSLGIARYNTAYRRQKRSPRRVVGA